MEERLLATHKTKCMKVNDRQCILQTVYKLSSLSASGRSTYTPAQVYASHIIILKHTTYCQKELELELSAQLVQFGGLV